ncbi:MAG: PhzF family phenazine biosynthesis protein [Pseudomonadota bacterium]|nr:PhzF family phenazine biosynthesis protein [Pseudomonadota bacterium]
MQLDIYFVDAFTDNIFSGNPAAVIFTDLDDKSIMQKISAENNLSETAFVNLSDNNLIRWFSPIKEVDLCGHATLASAFIYFNYLDKKAESICFNSASGELIVNKKDKFLQLDFPKDEFQLTNDINSVASAVGVAPIQTYKGTINLMAVYEKEEDILKLSPDYEKVIGLDGQGLIVTAPGFHCDFVSRYFCPKYGINEDPVTGSAHTTLIPYWSERLNKNLLTAKQISKRGGDLFCENADNRVLIGGSAVLYMKGIIEID